MAEINAVETMQNDEQIEADLAAKFAKQDDAEPVKRPAKEEPEEEGEPETAAKATGDSQAEEAEEGPPDEEFEFEGKVYQAPRELKEAVLRHKDYTEKTMQTAEERKLLNQEREFVKLQADFQSKFTDTIAEQRALQSQLAQFEQLDWTTLANADQAQYLALDRQERMLRDKFTRKTQELQGLAQQFQQQAEGFRQQKLVAAREMLRKEFKGEPADIGERLAKTGEAYGFTAQELAMLDDPRQARVLRDAMKWRDLQSAKPTVNKRAETAAPLKVQASRSAQSSKIAADVEASKARLAKSHRAEDAEDYLTRLLTSRKEVNHDASRSNL